jgi:hypothetical protein
LSSPRPLRRLAVSGCLLVALAGPARCDESFARYDVVLSRHILHLSTLLSESSRLFQDWTKGRYSSPEAQAGLRARLEQARSEQAQLNALKSPAGLEQLTSRARQYARAQIDVIEGAAGLVKAGPPDRDALRHFVDQSLSGSRLNQLQWFRARQNVMARALKGPLSPTLASYYRWLAQWLPVWTDESNISSQVERLLSAYRRDTAEASSREALQLIRQALALRDRASRFAAVKGVDALQRAAVDELSAMAAVCNAVNSLLDDPSSDSVDRLHRTVNTVTERSQDVEKLSVEALATASQPGKSTGKSPTRGGL